MAFRDKRKGWLYVLPMIALVALLAIVAMGGNGGLASAAAPTRQSNVSADAASKIDARVLQDTANGGSAEFMVTLSSQADISSASTMRDQDAQGWYVYNTLKEHATRTQSDLRAALSQATVSFKSYWVVNAMLVTGDRSVVDMLAARSDVARIDSNRPTRWIEDETVANSTTANALSTVIEWGVMNVRAPEVWAMGFTGQGVVVGGLDTGIRWTHNAIKNQYRGWNGATADHNYNWWDSIHSGGGVCTPNHQEPCDDNAHGTHTVGTMVGDDGTGNQIGVAPGAKWIGCRNMDQGNGTPATYTECFQFMIAPTDLAGQNANPALRPHVLNNSWACPPSEGCTDVNILHQIITNTQAAGILVSFSAGNSGPACSTVITPGAFYDEAFSIGAIDISNTLAGFSSRGPVTVDGSNRLKPNVSAPGVNVRSATNASDTSYSSFSGTSMASPHDAGVVALLWSARPQLVRDVAGTRNILQNTANPAVTVSGGVQTCGGIPSSQIPNNSFGYGRIDVVAAVNSVPVATPTPIPPTATNTSVPPTATNTSVPPTATSIACLIQFSDVPVTNTFYTAIRCLACRGIVSGYSDGTFRPNNLVTRGQLAKIVSNAAGFSEPPGVVQRYEDVPLSNTFFEFIERLSSRGYMSGYPCGGPGEPCRTGMPYFRPFANATRGQTAKIVANAAGFTDPPTGQTFEDVSPTSTFYQEIQRLATRNVMSGYACGGPGEPCVEPTNRPYFRPGNAVTRGQSSKIVANTFFPDCNPVAR